MPSRPDSRKKETNMASPNDVMAILKAVSCKLSNGNVMVLSFMYHTELDPADPAGKKKDRSKSQYRYEGIIFTEADLQAKIAQMKADPDAPWRWPSLETWRTSYDNEPTSKRGAKWLEARLKKAVDWKTCEKLMAGWKPSKNDFKDSRKYDTTGYMVANGPSTGQLVDLKEDVLIALDPGTTFSKILTPKRG